MIENSQPAELRNYQAIQKQFDSRSLGLNCVNY